MKITYIYHSGFLIETEQAGIVIDFYKDFPINGKEILSNTLSHSGKKLYVLSSHSHYDHFNPEILDWKQKRDDITYILSKDILAHSPSLYKVDALWMEKGDVFHDGCLKVKAFGSTDLGISFLIEADGKTVFHAGDLNNWHWMDETPEEEWKNDENNYLVELEDIWKEYHDIDVVMFPVDYRLGSEYMRGAKQFVNKIDTRYFLPIHFGENYASTHKFHSYCADKGIIFFDINRKGQTFII